MKTTEIIRQFIIENFIFEDDENLKEDTSFMENGILDSTGILELIAFIEENFGFAMEDEEIIPENLDSLKAAAAYVKRKTCCD